MVKAVYYSIRKGNKILRKYTVTDKDYKSGDEFIHNGRKYRRSRIGKAIFDHDISSERTTEMVDEFVAGSKLSNKAYNKKYGV